MRNGAIEVVVDAELVDLASGLLWGAGVSAVAEHPVDDVAIDAPRVLLRSDVPPGGVVAVRAALGDITADIRQVEIIDDGLDSWREHARVASAGRRLVVRPPWVPLGEVQSHAVVVELDPGRSWGHGAHPTTLLCLAEVERLVDERPGCTVFDVGCGSGALSVAAAMLGAGRVEACDLDPAACDATVANATRNGVADRVSVHHVGPQSARDPLRDLTGTADLIVANIGAAALVDLAPRLIERLAPGGVLVLSGLLDPPPAEVAAAYAQFEPAISRLDGWSSLALQAPNERSAASRFDR